MVVVVVIVVVVLSYIASCKFKHSPPQLTSAFSVLRSLTRTSAQPLTLVSVPHLSTPFSLCEEGFRLMDLTC